jgi:two-component system, NarL family, response regulator LiaR
MPVKVLVVDDHAMVRQGLQMYFEDDPDVQIVGEARNGEEAVTLAPQMQPGVVLMDLLMPAMDGVQAIKALRVSVPQCHIVAMTSVVEEAGVHRAIEAGAIGYVLKDTRPDELRDAVLAAADGRVRFHPESAGRLLREVSTPDIDPATLPAKDLEVLRLLSQGRSAAEIAQEVGCDTPAAERALASILERLGLSGRAQAVLYATRKGLVPAELRPYLS